MNDTTIQMIAQAVIANTKVIQSLIEALPHEVKTAIAEAVTVSAPVPVAPAPAPVVQAAPVVTMETAVVIANPEMLVRPTMPAPPTFVVPVAAPVVQVPVQGTAPFSDGKGLIDYVMNSYKALGAAKGAGIQAVLTSLNYQNINDVKPEHYVALFSGIEALKG